MSLFNNDVYKWVWLLNVSSMNDLPNRWRMLMLPTVPYVHRSLT